MTESPEAREARHQARRVRQADAAARDQAEQAITRAARARQPAKQCAGVRYATGSSQCWAEPVWAVYDTHHGGKPDRYACDRHLHNAIDRERGALVVPAEHHWDDR